MISKYCGITVNGNEKIEKWVLINVNPKKTLGTDNNYYDQFPNEVQCFISSLEDPYAIYQGEYYSRFPVEVTKEDNKYVLTQLVILSE